MLFSPLVVLLIGVALVIVLIVVVRLNAFLALITAAFVVSLLSPGEWGEKIGRAVSEFGATAGKIGVMIALAAVIGKCLMDSGSADRIVRTCLALIGESRAPIALMTSGFVLSIPVFFDTVFYLLVPLARSLCRITQSYYSLSVLAIGAGAALTHTLVPPTPGPLAVAGTLGVEVGHMILIGVLVGIPAAVLVYPLVKLLDRAMPLPVRPYVGETETAVSPVGDLPPFWLAIAPVLLPVLLISANTIAKVVVKTNPSWQGFADLAGVIGDPNLALLLAAVVAMGTVVWKRRLSLSALGRLTEEALMSAGVIILITSAGGAFGAMLRQTGMSEQIKIFAGAQSSSGGLLLLLMGFFIAAVMKTAQGSSTVAMLTTAAIMAALFDTPEALAAHLHCHPVYLALAIGAGSLVFCWMNDSGFWVVARMSVWSEFEALKLWTVTAAGAGLAAFFVIIVYALLLPGAFG
ncbi:MAG: GntP family permease [Thermogutta sp.]